MNVLSLFDGMSCGRIALERAGIPVNNYFASEIDKYAIKVAQANWPDNLQLGDVTKWKEWDIDWSSIDLLIGGSPCQSLSSLGDGSGLEGKSGLFFTYLDILNHIRQCNPSIKFLLENVKGSNEILDTISDLLGCNYVHINSNTFSAQNRSRVYWFNFGEDISIPCESDILLVDVLEEGIPPACELSPGRYRWLVSDKGQHCLSKKYATLDQDKASCLTARSDTSWNSNYVTRQGRLTRLTPVEYERLQTVPDNYTQCVSNSQRYKMLGNGWTVDVITHILSHIKQEEF